MQLDLSNYSDPEKQVKENLKSLLKEGLNSFAKDGVFYFEVEGECREKIFQWYEETKKLTKQECFYTRYFQKTLKELEQEEYTHEVYINNPHCSFPSWLKLKKVSN